MYRRQINCLAILAVLLAWVSVSIAGAVVSNEARRYMARGIAAAEMAKSVSDYDLAVKEFEQAAKLAPDWPDVYYNLGTAHAKAGDLTSAINNLQRYLDLAPQSPDAGKVQQEIFKLEYRRDREKLNTTLSGTWTSTDGQTFELKLDGSHLQLTRRSGSDDIITTKVMLHKTYPYGEGMPLVFTGTLAGEKISGGYLQAGMKTKHGGCVIPERKGNFEGTIDVAAGQIRIVYNRVKHHYEQKFSSFLSDEMVCRRTSRQEMPGYVLELKRNSQERTVKKDVKTTGNAQNAVPNGGNAPVPGNGTP